SFVDEELVAAAVQCGNGDERHPGIEIGKQIGWCAGREVGKVRGEQFGILVLLDRDILDLGESLDAEKFFGKVQRCQADCRSFDESDPAGFWRRLGTCRPREAKK